MRLRYDLHIHSCLSPCGDDVLTPAFVAGSAKLCGLDVAALTDHNSAKNCPAFFKAAEFYGLSPLGGLELSTVEGVHVLCLFDELEKIMEFDRFVSERLIKMENDPAFFGNQLVCDEEDEVLGEEKYLLSGDTDIAFNDVREIVLSYGGVALPAHIDRKVNGAVEIFGTVPAEAGFKVYEMRDRGSKEDYLQYMCADPLVIYNSDAHQAESIGCAGGAATVDDALVSELGAASALLRYIAESSK
ncbi:MAG: PHP domain-containing protein [Clostridia bacterium]|nr:PHP domain-containing protein [Clostridia bacterium]